MDKQPQKMPSKNKPALDDEQLQRKKIKGVSMSATCRSIFSQTKKGRRSTRELAPKQSKQARLLAENAAKVVAETLQQIGILTQKRKLLEKLHARHQAAARSDAASETQGQIDAVKTDLRLLEMDLKAVREEPLVTMADE